MKPTRLVLIPSLVGLALTFGALPDAPAYGQKAEWSVKGDLTGKKGKASEDVSGIACATATGFPRTCLVIDDELQAVQAVTLTEGTIAAGHMIALIDDKFDGKALELDGEGVAFADNYFYVIGSHGRPRHDKDATDTAKEAARIAARLNASSRLLRLKFDPATGAIANKPDPSRALAPLIAGEASFALFKDKALEDGGVTIEGIAVRDDRLFAGFRGPVIDNEKAVILSAALGHFFDGKPAEVKLHLLALGTGRGVRDLAVFDNGILILAGPMQDVGGTYSVFWWDGVSTSAKFLSDLPSYTSDKGKQWKPEALLPLDRDAKTLRVLVLLDGVKQGKPQTARIPYP